MDSILQDDFQTRGSFVPRRDGHGRIVKRCSPQPVPLALPPPPAPVFTPRPYGPLGGAGTALGTGTAA